MNWMVKLIVGVEQFHLCPCDGVGSEVDSAVVSD